MKTRRLAHQWFGSSMALLLCWLLLLTRAGAATVLSGNVSGTWMTNGSPYILTADCTVASNQTLNIQPGVEVIGGPNTRLFGSGAITAIGTPEESIIFRGTSTTNYWRGIFMEFSRFTNRFYYCRLSDTVEAALQFDVAGRNRVVSAEVINCVFFNCGLAIFGYAEGQDASQPVPGSAMFTAEIHNCVFDSNGLGCILAARSAPFPGNATVHADISGNIFKNLRYTAFALSGSGTNISRPSFVNNTVANGNGGIYVQGPFEPVIRNNLLLRNGYGIRTEGDRGVTNAVISYNCFYSNSANFVGFPGIYGASFQNNHNGDPCDAFFNIFLDPQFLDTNRFLLSNASPCIDAGDPAIADVCFEFSRGSAISDIGAYGGPEACGWLTHGFAPVIARPPSDQSSCVGGSATFKVRAEGSEPFSYRWYFNGNTLLAGETNSQLTLMNLETNEAGLYSATVSNGFGSVTSAPARLHVFDACVGIHLYAGLSITGVVGRTYNVEYVTNLAATNWTVLASNTFSTPRWLFIDTNTPFDAKKFFRVRLAP